MSELTDLLAAVRKQALPGLWSKGVSLARDGAVSIQTRSDKEIELRVKAGRPVPWTAVLYPQDQSWECDCPSRVDPCDHVVAAVIALQQHAPAPAQEVKWTRVLHRFTREGNGLALHRTLVHANGTEQPLVGTLTAMLAQPGQSQDLQVEHADLLADRMLEKPHRGPLPEERLANLFKVLQNARNVLLDGQAVVISDEVVLPYALVEDEGAGIRISILRNPQVTQVVLPGVLLCGDVLAFAGETGLTGPRLNLLPLVRRYTQDQVGELTAQVIPDLARRIPVTVHSTRIPKVDATLTPRLNLELTQVDSGLSILPTLVYGSPATVRIDGARMVYLRGAVPLRDVAAETKLADRLRDQLNLMPGRRTMVPAQDVGAWAERLRRWHGSMSGDAARLVGANIKLTPRWVMANLSSGDAPPQVRLSLEFEGNDPQGGGRFSVDGAAVMAAWQQGNSLVPLLEGGWAPLPMDWLSRYGPRVADLLAARLPDGNLANHALPQLAALCSELQEPGPLGLEKLAPLVDGFESLAKPVLPDDVQATLRPYQLDGVAWLQFLQRAGLGGILADDMGLGKTLQAMCILKENALVVCPTSVLANWAAELKRFRPNLRVCAYHGPARTLDAQAHVTLTTYALLRLDKAVLTTRNWDVVILDEAQAIKNADSQAARAAFELKATTRLALSGTPVENRLEELWSMMNFCNPGLLGSRADFDDRVVQPVSRGEAGAAARLRQRLKAFVLRRLKAAVAPELPPRTENILRVTLDERERNIYDAIFAATREEVVGLLQHGGSVIKALEALLRLRQAACHPALVPGQEAATSSKVGQLLQSLGTAVADGHKALVFSQWTSLLDLVEGPLRDAGLGFVRLDGSTSNRGDITARFQAPDGPPVMLISLKAGGTGLNLTAADHVFLLDPWWNPAVEAQAADRAHRIGQTRPVNIYRLVAQGTVEERILLLQEQKRALFEAALGEGQNAGGLTKEDLLALFA
jgi:superfamily II DNA or RNA helicase